MTSDIGAQPGSSSDREEVSLAPRRCYPVLCSLPRHLYPFSLHLPTCPAGIQRAPPFSTRAPLPCHSTRLPGCFLPLDAQTATPPSLALQEVLFEEGSYLIKSRANDMIAFNFEVANLLRVLRGASVNGADLLEIKLAMRSVAVNGSSEPASKPFLTFTGRVGPSLLRLPSTEGDERRGLLVWMGFTGHGKLSMGRRTL